MDSPRLVGEDELPELEVPEDDAVLVADGDGSRRLPEEGPGLGFAQLLARLDVGVEVAVIALEEEVAFATGVDEAGYGAHSTGALETQVRLEEILRALVAHCQLLKIQGYG
jgi:hypothetical protein